MSKLFTLSGPRGVGKTHTINRLEAEHGIQVVWPFTDRQKRPDDEKSPKYKFVSPDEYTEMLGCNVLTACIELATGERYGTSREDLTHATDESGTELYIVTSATGTALDIRRSYNNTKSMLLVPDNPANIPIMMANSGIPQDEITLRMENDPNSLANISSFDRVFVNPLDDNDVAVSAIYSYMAS